MNTHRLVAILVVTVGVISLLYIIGPSKETHVTTLAHDAACYTIAIFTPTTHPALEEIEQGFKEGLQKSADAAYSFTVFNANGNKTLLRAQAEEIVMGDYDLVCTLGATCTQTIAELLHKKGKDMPHVFCAIDGLEVAQDMRALNHSTTGVYVAPDYRSEIELLYALKPTICKVLIVYDPTHGIGLEKYKNEVTDYIVQHGSQVRAVEVYQTNEIQQKVAALLPDMDVILVLVDNTVVAGIDALVTLCNRYGVTLVASDLASGKRGAALAYGITEYESGSSAADVAHAILVEKKAYQEIPLAAVKSFRGSINKDTMYLQKLSYNADILKRFNAR